MEVTVIDVLKQMAIAIPSILVGTQTITAAIHGAFKIEDKNWVHAISWIIATLGRPWLRGLQRPGLRTAHGMELRGGRYLRTHRRRMLQRMVRLAVD